ncbi:MAG: MrtC family glutamic-type intramembrane protease [Deltaproteobacteria bacterium]|nr:MrtC family glutamic-type intramembrane protease [Deltaproteobacteria bacterium]
MGSPARRTALWHLALSYLVVNGLVLVLSRGVAQRYGLHDLIGALFLMGALYSVRRDDDDTGRYGVTLGGLFPGAAGDRRSLVTALIQSVPSALRELVVALGVAAVVLPIYAYFWPKFNVAPASRAFALDAARLREIATQLLAVALTEELYFRGYVQTRIADALGIARDETSRKSVRVMVAPIVLASLLFALTHVTVAPTLPRAVVFFPGLLFGVLRVWRGGIGAAVFLHATSNLFESWLEGR